MTPTEFEFIKQGFSDLREGLGQMVERMNHLDECVDGLKDEVRETTGKFENLLDQVASSIPNKDFVGHRIAHEDMMVAARKWEGRKNTMVNKAIEWLTVGMLGILIASLSGYLQIGP